jgi:predicted metal-binding membrane protein
MNQTSIPESNPNRDRLIVLSGIAGAVAIAWVYLVIEAVEMPAMKMVGSHVVATTRMKPWTVVHFWLTFVMWSVMMVGMMLPSATPAILGFAGTSRDRQGQDQAFAPTAAFALGYVTVWTAFSFIATFLQWGLRSAALLSPMMVGTSPLLGGILLVVAGIYQWTPTHRHALERLRAPLESIVTRWREGTGGAFVMGLENGASCVASCWVVMGLLFVGGVMNLLWVAAITIFVLIEKAAPHGDLVGRICGVVLLLKGAFVIFHFF